MTKNDDSRGPLPEDWLPRSPVPPEEEVDYWETRIQGMLSAAEPTLAEYRRVPSPSISWVEALALRWRPATVGALALAASAVIAMAVGAGRHAAPTPRDIALSTIVGGGEPAALWSGAGVAADPTLAVLTLESGAERPGGTR